MPQLLEDAGMQGLAARGVDFDAVLRLEVSRMGTECEGKDRVKVEGGKKKGGLKVENCK
jgi:hypothetical protein